MQDFNSAGTQRSFDLIPHGQIADVSMHIRPGGHGDDGWLKGSKDGRSAALDLEFTVLEGQFARQKFWSLMTVSGETQGHADAAQITGSRIRAMLESAKGFRPDDMSDDAADARRIRDFGDLDGLRFVAKIGIEKPRREWHKVVQVVSQAAKPAAPSQPAPAAISKPAWAQ